MRSFISRAEQYARYKDIDRIHDSSIYDMKPGESKYIEVNTFNPDFTDLDPPPPADAEPANEWRAPMLSQASHQELLVKIRANQTQIREQARLLEPVEKQPRIQASNRKCAATTIESDRQRRSKIVSAQCQTWRSLLPNLIKKLSKIPDPRDPKRIDHKLTVLMVFGLFGFIFRMQSRREMNRELTGPVIFEALKKLFPEIDSIPHADTLARLLARINPLEIEAVHINLLRDLIKLKKFRKMLIHDCLPISVDGTQKLYRDGLLQDPCWCERSVGTEEPKQKQQYLYAIEANITLKNGLNIPLMTEFTCARRVYIAVMINLMNLKVSRIMR